ncbi:MAG: 30S ribosomal protein S12 methylthiotransferase RimO [Sandaracinaceae bacterium]
MSAEPKTIHFVSLGCPKNRVDTEVMLGVSQLHAHRLVGEAEDADVIVVNTCGFIDAAKEESIETILAMSQLRQSGRCSSLVVAGCLSQRYPEELAAEMPEVDHFLGSGDMLKLGAVLAADGERAPRMLVGNPAEYTIRATDPRELSQGLHSAYVKIAEGCNRTCAFCTIPSFRGKQRSRPVADVVAEARRLVDAGTAELNLISQDTIAYGRDLSDGTDLATLVRAVADVEGLRWLRLFYLYPERLRGELVELLAGHDKVLPYVDMPLQHASDAMLKRMRRGHGGERLYELVEQLRERIGDRMVFRTAFIVGHPGETEADFEALLDFVTWARFDRIGVFRYSKEESTRSGEMEDEVPEELAEERRDRLLAAQAPISRAKVRAMLGTDVDVLVERVSEESELLLEGRWWGQAPEIDGKVYLANGEARPGEIRRAYVTQAAEHDLVADLYERDGTLPEPPPGSDPRPKRRHLPTL